jgi:C4-dicarboxylate-specific signal transduction histidine kinase
VTTTRRKRVNSTKSAQYQRAQQAEQQEQNAPAALDAPPPAAPFALLRAAHRARMAQWLAGVTADKLREIAQVVGLTQDITRRGKAPTAGVMRAMMTADESLSAQIDALDLFAQQHRDGPVNVRDVVQQALAVVDRPMGPCQVDTVVDLPERMPAVSADPVDLLEILFALLVNAREAVAERHSCTIRVSAAVRAKAIAVEVADNGPGISAALRKNAFDPFVTGHRNESHLGIGLAVARQLARNHGGEIRYDARAKGARFVLTLPVWEGSAARR